MKDCASFLGDSSSPDRDNCSISNPDNSALQESPNSQLASCDRPDTIVPEHWEEWVVGSGVSPAIVATNVTSLRTPKEFKSATNRHSLTNAEIADYLPAWQVESKGYPAGYQIKPAIPWKGEAKYLTPRKHKAHPIFLDAPDIDWEQIKSDRSIPLLITEGTKKAGCGLTHKLATISISGVWNGQIKGRLTDLIEQFVRNGRRVYLAFDSDVMDNAQVQKALKRFGALILDAGGIPYIIQIPDLSEDGKMGMDDFIVSEGIDAFKALIREAPTLQEWRESLAPAEKETAPRRPEPQDMAAELAEDLRDSFRYDNTRATWVQWDGRRWKRMNELDMLQRIHRELLSRNIRFKTFSYIRDVFTQLKLFLSEPEWTQADPRRYINFANGVLDIKAGKLRAHSPGYMFTSYIDRDYEPIELSGDCIQDLRDRAPYFWHYANFAMGGDERKIAKMVAAIAAVLRWKFSKLQMFLQLVGEPAAGKGVFARLLQEMVGKERYGASALNKLCGGREDYATASIIDKQVVICSDERKLKPGSENTILKLTGGDLIPFRHPAQPYRYAPFEGSLIVISNFPIFSGDLSGIDRRSCLIHFPNPVPKSRRDYRFEDALHTDINALTNIAFAMPEKEMEALLKGTGESHISDFRAQEWRDKCETDSIAAWMDATVRESPSDRVSIKALHESYLQWCAANGERHPVGSRYIKRRIFAHTRWLEWDVRDGRTNVERYVRGLRIDSRPPSIEDTLEPMPYERDVSPAYDIGGDRGGPAPPENSKHKGLRTKDSSPPRAVQLELPSLPEWSDRSRDSNISGASDRSVETWLDTGEPTFPAVWNNPEFWRNRNDRGSVSPDSIATSGPEEPNAGGTLSSPPPDDTVTPSQSGDASDRDRKPSPMAGDSNSQERKGLDDIPGSTPFRIDISGNKRFDTQESSSPPSGDTTDFLYDRPADDRDRKPPKDAKGPNPKERKGPEASDNDFHNGNGLHNGSDNGFHDGSDSGFHHGSGNGFHNGSDNGLNNAPDSTPPPAEDRPDSSTPSDPASKNGTNSKRSRSPNSSQEKTGDRDRNGRSSTSPPPAPPPSPSPPQSPPPTEGSDRSSKPPGEPVPPDRTPDLPTEGFHQHADLSHMPHEIRSAVTRIERLASNPQKALEEWGRTSFRLLSRPDALQQIWRSISPSTQQAIQRAADRHT